MYCGYNLNANTSDFKQFLRLAYKDYHEIGLSVLIEQKKSIIDQLESFILYDDSLDGSKMQANWFPQVDADIFISHSHKDERDVITLAGILIEGYGLNVFIDSCIWGYSDDLLKIIDRKYCMHPNGISFWYEKRNFSTSHVHMMLSSALLAMMDDTECVFLYNTPNSISAKDVIDKTSSPWIYSEINMSRLIRKKNKECHRSRYIRESVEKSFSGMEAMNIEYKVNTTHLVDINFPLFNKWIQEASNKSKKGTDALDMLYKITDIERSN